MSSRILPALLFFGLGAFGCQGARHKKHDASEPVGGAQANGGAEASELAESAESEAQAPVVRDVYRQAASALRGQLDSTSIEERLRALAMQIERETKEIP